MPWLQVTAGPVRGRTIGIQDGEPITSHAGMPLEVPALQGYPTVLARFKTDDHDWWLEVYAPGVILVNGQSGASLRMTEGALIQLPTLGCEWKFVKRPPTSLQLQLDTQQEAQQQAQQQVNGHPSPHRLSPLPSRGSVPEPAPDPTVKLASAGPEQGAIRLRPSSLGPEPPRPSTAPSTELVTLKPHSSAIHPLQAGQPAVTPRASLSQPTGRGSTPITEPLASEQPWPSNAQPPSGTLREPIRPMSPATPGASWDTGVPPHVAPEGWNHDTEVEPIAHVKGFQRPSVPLAAHPQTPAPTQADSGAHARGSSLFPANPSPSRRVQDGLLLAVGTSLLTVGLLLLLVQLWPALLTPDRGSLPNAPTDIAATVAPASPPRLEIQSQPTGQIVWINGEKRGQTPLVIEATEGETLRIQSQPAGQSNQAPTTESLLMTSLKAGTVYVVQLVERAPQSTEHCCGPTGGGRPPFPPRPIQTRRDPNRTEPPAEPTPPPLRPTDVTPSGPLAKLRVNAPDDYSVIVDGKPQGSTPVETTITAGDHVFVVSGGGLSTRFRYTVPEKGLTLRINLVKQELAANGKLQKLENVK